jgi:TolB protein
MKSVKLLFCLVVLLAALFSRLFGQTDVYLRAYAKTFQRLTVDLYPFEAESVTEHSVETAALITHVLSNDLWMSGYFQVNIKSGSPESPNDMVDNGGVGDAKALAQIVGQYRLQGDKITIRPKVIDAASKRPILSNNYSERSDSKRTLIHRISDDIVFQLTGERGIAGSKIVFVQQNSNGTKEIASMDYDGHDIQRTTSDKTINISPAWAPDGKKICFTSYQNGEPDVFVLDLRTKQVSLVSNFQGLNSAPDWSPDGRKIALTLSKDGNAEIYLLEIERGKFRRLTFSRAIDSSPTWSPSNREIAFTSDRSGTPQIYVMDSDGLNLRRLTFKGSYNDSSVWSPRGDKVAFVPRTDSGFDIYTIDVDGLNLMRLTDSSGSNENPSWSPNGYALVFSSTRSGHKELYSMFWDGSDQKQITSSGIHYSPAWSPRIN